MDPLCRRALVSVPLCLALAWVAPACDGLRVDAALSDGGVRDDAFAATPDGAVPATGPGVALWRLPRGADRNDEFALPWPTDLARDAMGRVDLQWFPHEGVHTLVRQYLSTFSGRLDGFSLQPTVYLRFGVALDATSLPADAARTRDPSSPLQLVDIDPASPERGRRVPLQWYFREAPTRYWAANSLAVAPVWGYPLRPRTRYALVATTDLRGAGGARLRRDADLDAVLGGVALDAAGERARAIYRPAAEALATLGVPASAVLSLAVFTTQDPTEEFLRAADWLRRDGPQPALEGDLSAPDVGEFYVTLRGHYGPNPNFQSGTNPYNAMGSGDFVLNAQGVPQVQGRESIRFALTLPRTAMPAGGFPVAIYAHGTGGDYQSFIRDSTAQTLAAQGVATLGFDQVFHGERAAPGSSPESAFFNFGNPAAGRTNNRQAALDLIQCGRFVRRLTFSIPDGGASRAVRFDPERVFFFGHSQGGLNGPLWLAAEDGARAAVLSGAAGSIALSLLEKRAPVDIPALLNSLLQLERGIPGVPDELVPLHPIAALLQLLVDPSDPVSYARYIVREPRAGNRPKHVFQTQGFVDSYAPPAGIAALALSIGLPLAQPVLHEESGWALLNTPAPMLPLSGNLSGTTGAWMQFDAPRGTDGHFVIFRVRGAQNRAALFLGSAGRAEDGVPTLPSMF
jgi:hypothetical protein